MNNKSRSGLLIIAGGYLVYLGFKLMRDVIADGADNAAILMICAVSFMVAGALITIYYVRNMIKQNAEEAEVLEADEIETAVDAEGIEAAAVEQDNEELPVEAVEDKIE